MQPYDSHFYANRNHATRNAAQQILDVVLAAIPNIQSALDIGCGVGTWLSVLQDKGIKKILGVDGYFVKEEQLEIPTACFRRHDLGQPISWDTKFDLAISLEVAEHLPETRAKSFVHDLTAAANYVLFSAAIPHQGGYHHVNERWQSYWAALFEDFGYAPLDIIRPRFWQNSDIPSWYRQNMFLYVKNGTAIRAQNSALPLDVVHPDTYLPKVEPDDFRYGLSLAKRAFFRQIKSRDKR